MSFYDKPTPFYMFKDFIINLLVTKKTYKEILLALEKKWVKYSYSAFAKYANTLKREGLPETSTTIKSYIFTRFNLMKLFWNFENAATNVFKLLDYALEDFPIIEDIFMAIDTLKEVYECKDSGKLKE